MDEKQFVGRDEFLAEDDRQYEDVQLPSGKWVTVQSLNAAEKDAYEASMMSVRQVKGRVVTTPDFQNMRAKLFVLCVVDPKTYQRVYSDADIQAVGKKSAATLDVVIDAAKRLSAWDDADLEKLMAGLKNDQPAASPIG